jgi:hypothetical protein
MAQYSGPAKVIVNGAFVAAVNGAKVNIGGKQLETKRGPGWQGHMVTDQLPGRVEFSLQHSAATRLRALHDITEGVTVQIETDTGIQFVVSEAFSVDPPEFDSGSGEVPFVYEGQKAQETTAAATVEA